MRPRSLVSICLLVALCLAGCHGLERSAPPLPRRVAVLDLRVSEDIRQNKEKRVGYWFGKRTHYQDPLAGSQFADVLSARLHDLDYVEQVSRYELKNNYMVDKLELLRQAFGGLSEDEYVRMLEQVSPLDFGLDLGVDQVLTGRVIEAYTSYGHLLSAWKSVARVEVDLWDMGAGEIVWTQVFEGDRWFFSQKEAMTEAAGRAVEELDDYYRAQAAPIP